MGRGAGNCFIENLLAFLKNPKYKFYETLKFIEKYMLQLKKDGVVWGYDVPYLVTGYLNQHPRAAMAFSKDKRQDYSKFYDEVISQE